MRARDVENLGIDGMRARVTTPAGERVIHTPLLGRGNLANVLAATAVALDFDVPLDDIVAAAARLKPADRRGAVRRLRGGIVLIDDSYNSSPSALAARARRRRPGDAGVAEGGRPRRDARARRAFAGAAPRIGQGRRGRRTASAVRRLAALPRERWPMRRSQPGMPASAVRYAEKSEVAARDIAAAIKAGDLVLVKGSRGTRTDIVADRIAAEFA